jgi:hypothetical protein
MPESSKGAAPSEDESPAALLQLFGASLLSAAGSLPLHLAPLIVATLIADARATVFEAGLIPSATLIGQLSVALALPVLAVSQITYSWSIALAVAIVLALLTTLVAGVPTIIAGWFVVGQCCGAFMYAATVAASRFPDRVLAFSLRLSLVLVVAGTTAGLLHIFGAFGRYQDLVIGLVLVLTPLLTVALILRKPSETPSDAVSVQNVAASGRWSLRTVVSLSAVFVFFLGQTGFLAYVIQQAVARGIGLNQSVAALIAAKFVTGVWMLVTIRSLKGNDRGTSNLFYRGALLASVNVGAFWVGSPLVLFAALLTFEFMINSLSARLQGAVTASQAELTGQWLTGAILFGAATGPILNGVAISWRLEPLFVCISAMSALVPFAFAISAQSR